jgi:hypothetical protein
VAYDADDAGEAAAAFWLHALPGARRWRPYWGDPAQMLQDGADVAGWIAAGLDSEVVGASRPPAAPSLAPVALCSVERGTAPFGLDFPAEALAVWDAPTHARALALRWYADEHEAELLERVAHGLEIVRGVPIGAPFLAHLSAEIRRGPSGPEATLVRGALRRVCEALTPA